MDDRHVFSLHRYFLQANQMRIHFVQTLGETPGRSAEENKIYQLLYQGLWYGSLYVVVEGWRTLKLKDPVVDELLASNYVLLLRRYRNGVFHFQKNYYDDRFLDFMRPPDTPEWVHDVHSAFGRYFLDWFADRKSQRRAQQLP